MGFRPEPTIYNIEFEGTSLDGLHVRASACTVGEYEHMLQLIVDANKQGNVSQDILDGNDWLKQLFLNHLVSWDLEDYITGEPIPATLEGIRTQERGVFSVILQGWQTAIVSVPKASKKNSNDGMTSPEQPPGLASSSESLGS
jgi:hypothetical protein